MPALFCRLTPGHSRSFVEKLLSALHHPEPQTAVRVAWILGERHERAAVPDLIRTVETAEDGFLVEAAVEALGKIEAPRALECLKQACQHGPIRVRHAARNAVERILNEESVLGLKRKNS